MPDEDTPYGTLLLQRIFRIEGHNELAAVESWPVFDNLWYHQDLLNSTRAVTDERGRIISRFEYGDWGEVYSYVRNSLYKFDMTKPVTPETHLGRNITQHLYTGAKQDMYTRLVYLDSRVYDPGRALFNQPDPFNLAELQLPVAARQILVQQMGLNLNMLLYDPSQQIKHSYVSNNPLKWIDPMGLAWFLQPDEKNAVGRKDTWIDDKPGGRGEILSKYVPAMQTMGKIHDTLVDGLVRMGIGDTLANIPTMIPSYITAVAIETINSIVGRDFTDAVVESFDNFFKGVNNVVEKVKNFFSCL